VRGGLQTRIMLGACIALATAACSGDVVVESKPGDGFEKVGSDPLLPLLELSVDAPWTTTYQGTRRVEARYVAGGVETELAYRETVSADGTGNFAVETVDVLSFLSDPTTFLVTQDLREGFFYRYRDFAVRDLGAFYLAHVAIDLGTDVQIAGRTCQEILVQSEFPGQPSFQVALDVETGLVLRSIETDGYGVEVQRMEFETFDPAPDLSGVAWFQPAIPEIALDLSGDLDAQVGFQVLSPSLLPDGYQPWKAATITEPGGREWVKQTYTDGVEPLFFFHSDAVQPVVPAGPSGSTAGTSAPLGDNLYVYAIGPVTVIEGHLRGHEVIALGKTDSDSMLDLLESAID